MRTVEEIRRLKLAQLESDLGSLRAVAELTGIDKSQLSQWKNASPDSKTGKPRNMSSRSARRIEELAGKPALWMDHENLIFKDGEWFVDEYSRDEQAFDEGVADGQRHNYQVKKEEPSNVSTASFQGGMIPEISFVQAGQWGEAADPFQPGDAERWHLRVEGGENTFVLRVDGDSMTAPMGFSPSFPDGIRIHVDPDQRNPENGEFVVAKRLGTDDVTFKQFKIGEGGRPYLSPLNPEHKPIYDEFRVIGIVVFAGFSLR